MIAMMTYWIRDIGIDGYRCNGAETVPIDFWNIARKELDKIKQVIMISDGDIPEHHVKAFDLTYSWNIYNALDDIIIGQKSVQILTDILKMESLLYPRGSLRLRFITRSDINGFIETAVKRFAPDGARALAIITFTLPGVPLIYCGEEVGNAKSLNIFEKTEIDWSRNDSYKKFYEKLNVIREEHPSIRFGNYSIIENSNSMNVYSFIRTNANDTIVVVINFSHEAKQVNIKLPYSSPLTWMECFTGSLVKLDNLQLELRLSPFSFVILSPTKGWENK